jgi:S1-C subfamily serine protease
MIVVTGPIKKKQLEEKVIKKLNSLKSLFVIFFIGLSLLAFLPFKLNLFRSGPILNENIMAAIARVNTGSGSGSAFLISSNKLITARHVVEDFNEGELVTLDFEKALTKLTDVEAKIIYLPENENKDFAILELTHPINNIPYLQLVSSDAISINDKINIVGYPATLFSSTIGTISNNLIQENTDLLQLNAGAWPGSSGGPVLIDATDQVVGILVLGLEGQYKGMVFALKSDVILKDPEIIKRGISLSN